MDNYVYFGKRAHFSCLSNGDQNSDALTAANFGIVPADRAYNDGSTEAAVGIEVFIRALSTANDTRGTALASQGDAVTGGSFALGLTSDTDRSDSGDVTKLVPASYVISSGVLQVRNFATDGTNGYLINAADQIIVRELIGSTNNALTDVGAIQQNACFNMANFKGCDPVDTATAATIGVGIVGELGVSTSTVAEIDQTRITFAGGDGGTTRDDVILTHTAGKFKDICAAMESLRNGSYAKMGKGMYTFTDLISGGKTFWDNEFGIIGCHLVNTAHS